MTIILISLFVLMVLFVLWEVFVVFPRDMAGIAGWVAGESQRKIGRGRDANA